MFVVYRYRMTSSETVSRRQLPDIVDETFERSHCMVAEGQENSRHGNFQSFFFIVNHENTPHGVHYRAPLIEKTNPGETLQPSKWQGLDLTVKCSKWGISNWRKWGVLY